MEKSGQLMVNDQILLDLKKNGISRMMFWYRVNRLGWPVQKAATTPKVERKRYFTYNGQKKTLREWAEITGLPYGTLAYRVYKCRWDIAKVLETKQQKYRDYDEKSLKVDLSVNEVAYLAHRTDKEVCRLLRWGWTIREILLTPKYSKSVGLRHRNMDELHQFGIPC